MRLCCEGCATGAVKQGCAAGDVQRTGLCRERKARSAAAVSPSNSAAPPRTRDHGYSCRLPAVDSIISTPCWLLSAAQPAASWAPVALSASRTCCTSSPPVATPCTASSASRSPAHPRLSHPHSHAVHACNACVWPRTRQRVRRRSRCSLECKHDARNLAAGSHAAQWLQRLRRACREQELHLVKARLPRLVRLASGLACMHARACGRGTHSRGLAAPHEA
jgi:hypothetical protein